MSWYRVLLHCALPDGFSRDNEAIAGFYTTRFVEAPFDKAAGDVAIDQLRGEQKFRDLCGQLFGEPLLDAAEIALWNQAPDPDVLKIGFVFYPVNEHPEDAA